MTAFKRANENWSPFLTREFKVHFQITMCNITFMSNCNLFHFELVLSTYQDPAFSFEIFVQIV